MKIENIHTNFALGSDMVKGEFIKQNANTLVFGQIFEETLFSISKEFIFRDTLPTEKELPQKIATEVENNIGMSVIDSPSPIMKEVLPIENEEPSNFPFSRLIGQVNINEEIQLIDSSQGSIIPRNILTSEDKENNGDITRQWDIKKPGLNSKVQLNLMTEISQYGTSEEILKFKSQLVDYDEPNLRDQITHSPGLDFKHDNKALQKLDMLSSVKPESKIDIAKPNIGQESKVDFIVKKEFETYEVKDRTSNELISAKSTYPSGTHEENFKTKISKSISEVGITKDNSDVDITKDTSNVDITKDSRLGQAPVKSDVAITLSFVKGQEIEEKLKLGKEISRPGNLDQEINVKKEQVIQNEVNQIQNKDNQTQNKDNHIQKSEKTNSSFNWEAPVNQEGQGTEIKRSQDKEMHLKPSTNHMQKELDFKKTGALVQEVNIQKVVVEQMKIPDTSRQQINLQHSGWQQEQEFKGQDRSKKELIQDKKVVERKYPIIESIISFNRNSASDAEKKHSVIKKINSHEVLNNLSEANNNKLQKDANVTKSNNFELPIKSMIGSANEGSPQLSSFNKQSHLVEEVRPVAPMRPFQAQISEQIVKSFSLLQNKGISLMQVDLRPEFLGNVTISLVMEKGKMIGKILVGREEVKRMIEAQMNSLKNTLSNLSIKTDELTVEYSRGLREQGSQKDSFQEQNSYNQTGNGEKQKFFKNKQPNQFGLVGEEGEELAVNQNIIKSQTEINYVV